MLARKLSTAAAAASCEHPVSPSHLRVPNARLVSVVSAYAAYCVVVFSCCFFFERVELCERKVA